jgi:Fic family protein
MSKYENALKLWREYNVNTETDIDLHLDNFRILFAYNSGKIENAAVTYHDTREIFENRQVLNYSGDPHTIFELENQRLCYEFLKPKLAAREPLTVELIKSVHAVLTGGTYDERRYISQGERPGEFKKHDYVTGRAEVGSPPESVETDLSVLLDEIAEFSGEDVLKAAAYFHARFEYIHPFADGNGRVGRTLLNYFLMIRNHPPLIIYNEDKRDCYETLYQYDMEEKITPLLEFLKVQTEKTWDKALERQRRRENSRS